MKRVIFVLPLLVMCMVPALADSGELKIKTVKNMYNAAIKSSQNGQDDDTLSTLFKYSDKGLQNAIALSRISRMNDEGDGFSDCHSAYETLIINPSNGYGIDEAKSVDYRLLNNGKVRASVKYTGKENIRSSSFTAFKDFSLKCSGSSCKITDVFNFNGDSGKLDSEKLCR